MFGYFNLRAMIMLHLLKQIDQKRTRKENKPAARKAGFHMMLTICEKLNCAKADSDPIVFQALDGAEIMVQLKVPSSILFIFTLFTSS